MDTFMPPKLKKKALEIEHVYRVKAAGGIRIDFTFPKALPKRLVGQLLSGAGDMLRALGYGPTKGLSVVTGPGTKQHVYRVKTAAGNTMEFSFPMAVSRSTIRTLAREYELLSGLKRKPLKAVPKKVRGSP